MSEVKPGPGADIRTYSDRQLIERRDLHAERDREAGDGFRTTGQLDDEVFRRFSERNR